MADTLPPIERPNGKLYRPRAVRVDYMDDEDNWREEYPYKTVVLGTHDVEAARERAVQGRVCQYLTNPRIDWLRLGYASGRLCWINDDERGAACVVFDESDDPPEVSAALRGDQPTDELCGERFGKTGVCDMPKGHPPISEAMGWLHSETVRGVGS